MAGHILSSFKWVLVSCNKCVCLSRWRVQTREAEPREVEAGRSRVVGQPWASPLGVILEPPGSRYFRDVHVFHLSHLYISPGRWSSHTGGLLTILRQRHELTRSTPECYCKRLEKNWSVTSSCWVDSVPRSR